MRLDVSFIFLTDWASWYSSMVAQIGRPIWFGVSFCRDCRSYFAGLTCHKATGAHGMKHYVQSHAEGNKVPMPSTAFDIWFYLNVKIPDKTLPFHKSQKSIALLRFSLISKAFLDGEQRSSYSLDLDDFTRGWDQLLLLILIEIKSGQYNEWKWF